MCAGSSAALRYWFFFFFCPSATPSINMHRYRHGEHCCAPLCRLLTEPCIRCEALTSWPPTSTPSLFCSHLSLCSGGAGGLLHKREGPDALHQHRRRLLLPAPVHRLHPGHAHLPPQGGGQAAGLLQRGQGGCGRARLSRLTCFCRCVRCRWRDPQTRAVKLGSALNVSPCTSRTWHLVGS